MQTVNDARSDIELVLEMSPSLRNEIGAAIEAEHGCGSLLAIRELEEYVDIDAADIPRINAVRYTEDHILCDWFPADRGETGKECAVCRRQQRRPRRRLSRRLEPPR